MLQQTPQNLGPQFNTSMFLLLTTVQCHYLVNRLPPAVSGSGPLPSPGSALFAPEGFSHQPGMKTKRDHLMGEGFMGQPCKWGTSIRRNSVTWPPSLQGKLETSPSWGHRSKREGAMSACSPSIRSLGASSHPPYCPCLALYLAYNGSSANVESMNK